MFVQIKLVQYNVLNETHYAHFDFLFWVITRTGLQTHQFSHAVQKGCLSSTVWIPGLLSFVSSHMPEPNDFLRAKLASRLKSADVLNGGVVWCLKGETTDVTFQRDLVIVTQQRLASTPPSFIQADAVVMCCDGDPDAPFIVESDKDTLFCSKLHQIINTSKDLSDSVWRAERVTCIFQIKLANFGNFNNNGTIVKGDRDIQGSIVHHSLSQSNTVFIFK